MEALIRWLDTHKISFKPIDNEVVEIDGFGKLFLSDMSRVRSIFRGTKDKLEFNLMENPAVLMEEGIFYIAFEFGKNWYYYDLRDDFKFNILKYIGVRQPCKQEIPFVNLGIHTPYELLNGSGDISLWVRKAQWMGHTAIGICDRHTMAGTLQLQKECGKAGLKHVFGYSFTLQDNDEQIELKIYCQTRQGLQNLLRIQKELMVDSETHTLSFSSLLQYASGNVLVLGKRSSCWMEKSPGLLTEIEIAFDRVFYQVDLSEYKANRIDEEVLLATKYFFDHFYNRVTGSFRIEPILICDNYYLDKDDAGNKIILNKIASGASHEQSDDQYFKDTDEHFAVFQSLFDADKWDVEALFNRMCAHTVLIAENATAHFELGRMFMPEYILLPEEKARYGNRHTMFLSLLQEGLCKKIPIEKHTSYKKRLEEEIYIIESTNNVDYFLIQWDMIQEAHRRGIATGVGRGSAGGSLVACLLGITSIDPIEYDLIFSRFLVPERCGLNRVDEITCIGKSAAIETGASFVEVATPQGCLHLNPAARLRVRRNAERMTVAADELQAGDDLLFDNRDVLWTLKTVLKHG